MLLTLKRVLLAAFVAGTAVVVQGSPLKLDDRQTSAAVGYQNTAYFVNWGIYARKYNPTQLPASKLSTVLYAFANIQWDGTVVSTDAWADVQIPFPGDPTWDPNHNAYGCVKQLYKLKKQNRNLKVLLSIGGWTYSLNGAFNAVLTEAGRNTFAASAIKLMADWGFDGLDIDWEYPKDDSEAQAYVALLRTLRAELDKYSQRTTGGAYKFQLTAAVPAGAEHYQRLRLQEMAAYLDVFNLMAYDYSGSWDKTAGHQANLRPSTDNPQSTPFSTDAAVTYYINAGVAPSKIVLGMPLYGRSFQNTEGLGRPFSGVGGGSWEQGVWDYKDLPKPGAQVFRDDTTGATWSYDAAARELISYDTAPLVSAKVDYLKQRGLGGSMFWEASGDRADDGQSLIATSYRALGQVDARTNWLGYPESQYDNIRAGMPS